MTGFVSTLLMWGFAFSSAVAAPSQSPIADIVGMGDFSGTVLASKGAMPVSVSRGASHRSPLWRWASVTKQIIATLVMQEVAAGNIDIDKPLKLRSLGAYPTRTATVTGTEGGKTEGAYRLDTFGTPASLYGSPDDLWWFDRALMMGRVLPGAQRDQMGDGQPQLGYVALGQWVFSAPLKGCAAPVRIVERRGAIGGVEARNFILPDSDAVVIAFTDRSGFDLGEVWQGKGLSCNLLSVAACQ